MSLNNKATLFIVATPIGNLNEISNRALDVLNDTDILYCAEVANKSGAQLLTESEALETFDFEAMGYIPFDIDGNQKRKQQVEKYEILVPHIISVAMIGGL